MSAEDSHSNLRADIISLAGEVPGLSRSDLALRLVSVARTLRSRLALEESVVFAAIEKEASLPTLCMMATLRAEHAAIRDLLIEIEQDLHADQRDAVAGNLRELAAMIRTHDARESQLVPPIVERLLDSPAVLAAISHNDLN